ncbi:unnamed protein product, partial [marine sediment metagenome]
KEDTYLSISRDGSNISPKIRGKRNSQAVLP